MDDYLMYKYFGEEGPDGEFMSRIRDFFGSEKYARGRGRGRGRSSRRDSEGFMEDEFEDFFYNRAGGSSRDSYARGGGSSRDNYNYARGGSSRDGYNFQEMMENMSYEDKRKFMGKQEEHFNEQIARMVVSKLYHKEDGRKVSGEKYDMAKAHEICERFKGIIPSSINHYDVYVAINTQYHDCCELYKGWFGMDVDYKIVESAIDFWFKDDDFHKGNKIFEYFKEVIY